MRRILVYEHLSACAQGNDSLFAAGMAMRDALLRDLLALEGLTISVAVGSLRTGEAGLLPAGARALPCGGRPAAEWLAQQAWDHDAVWAIAPETEGLLASLAQAVGDARWLGCDGPTTALCSSKKTTLAHAAQHGVLTPLAFASRPGLTRWVVKPDDGAGAMATRVHATPAAAQADVQARMLRGAPAVLEAWVEGPPLSLSLLCAAGKAELLSVNRQHLSVDEQGWLAFEGVAVDVMPHGDARFAQLRRWAQTLVSTLPGLRGYVGVDLVWHASQGPVLIEINPRVTEAYVGLSARLGRNLGAAVLAAHAREALHAPG